MAAADVDDAGGAEGGGDDQMTTALSVARDLTALGKAGVAVGFRAAEAGVSLSFSVTRAVLGWVLPPLVAVADVGEAVTLGSLKASRVITATSLAGVDAALVAAGAEPGALGRIVAGREGYDAVTAIMTMVQAFLVPLAADGVSASDFARAAAALGALQRAERSAAVAAGRAPRGLRRLPSLAALPAPDRLARYVRFAAATYGKHGAEFLGVPRLPDVAPSALGPLGAAGEAVAPGRVLPDLRLRPEHIASIAGLANADDVLMIVESAGEVYSPGHYVAADDAGEAIAVVIRGTMSLADTITDLVCEPEPLRLVTGADGAVVEGHAHRGMLFAARRLSERLAEPVRAALAGHPGYSLVVVGHSLGAGTASLLAALWSHDEVLEDGSVSRALFPGLRCYAYAPPCVLSEPLATLPALRDTIISVVNGDDFVSRFGLATSRDLRSAVLALLQVDAGEGDVALAAAAADVGSLEEVPASAAACVGGGVLDAVRGAVVRDEPTLYPAGLTYVLRQDDEGGAVGRGVGVAAFAVDDAQAALGELFVCRSMFASHLPQRYVAVVEAACAGLV